MTPGSLVRSRRIWGGLSLIVAAILAMWANTCLLPAVRPEPPEPTIVLVITTPTLVPAITPTWVHAGSPTVHKAPTPMNFTVTPELPFRTPLPSATSTPTPEPPTATPSETPRPPATMRQRG